jgi:serine protease Do
VPAVTTPTVPGATTTLPPGFVRVTDDSGAISVAIPSTWTDVQTAGLLLDDGTTTPQLIASTDVAAYEATFDVPGISIVVAAPFADPNTTLTNVGLTGGCTFTTEPYSDAMFTGVAQVGTACGAGTASWKMIVANTLDGATGVVISLQTASPADQLAIDTALQTLVLS